MQSNRSRTEWKLLIDDVLWTTKMQSSNPFPEIQEFKDMPMQVEIYWK